MQIGYITYEIALSNQVIRLHFLKLVILYLNDDLYLKNENFISLVSINGMRLIEAYRSVHIESKKNAIFLYCALLRLKEMV